jgi:preprotein translocase subunit SecG
VIASCFALVGFTAALVVGLAADNGAQTILWRATIALAVCWIVGRFIGGIAQRATEESIEQHKKANPIEPEPPEMSGPKEPEATQVN